MSGLRYTDRLPSPQILKSTPNWVHALNEEGRAGQDETTLKPHRQQKYIDDDTACTAGDVWLPGDVIHSAIFYLSSGRVTEIRVLDGEIFTVRHIQRTGLWVVEAWENPKGVSLDDTTKFPLRYCSMLAYSRNQPLKGIINSDGTRKEWVIPKY